jgi:hypothetical protein
MREPARGSGETSSTSDDAHARVQSEEARDELRVRQGGAVVPERGVPQRVHHVLKRPVVGKLVPAELATSQVRFHTASGSGARLARSDAQEVRLDGAADEVLRAHAHQRPITGHPLIAGVSSLPCDLCRELARHSSSSSRRHFS